MRSPFFPRKREDLVLGFHQVRVTPVHDRDLVCLRRVVAMIIFGADIDSVPGERGPRYSRLWQIPGRPRLDPKIRGATSAF